MKKQLIAAVLATIPSVTLAAVNLEVGRGLEVIAVNGIPVDSPLFIGKVDNLKLPDGDNQLAVRAGQLVKDANVTKKYTSHVSVLTFKASNTTVKVAAPMLGTWDKGEAFDAAPEWHLTTNGQPISYQLGELKSITNMSVLRNFGEELDAFNRSNQAAALPQLAGVIQGNAKNIYDVPVATQASDTQSHATQNISSQETVTPGQQARFWFDKMTPAEKRDFISWAAQHL